MADTPKSNPAAETKAAGAEVRIPLHDPVPSIFADGCSGANVLAGCVRLDLFVERGWAGAPNTQPMVVGRIIVPLERFEMFARGMTELVNKLREERTKAAAAAGTAAKP